MKRLLKAKAQKNQLRVSQDVEPTERIYEMVNTEKTAEAMCEVLDNDIKK